MFSTATIFGNNFCSRTGRSSQNPCSKKPGAKSSLLPAYNVITAPIRNTRERLDAAYNDTYTFYCWANPAKKENCRTVVATVILYRSFIVSKHDELLLYLNVTMG